MLGDDLRATVDGEPNDGVGIEAFPVFGDPSATSRWAVQLDGHHVALNITLDGDAYSLSPSFIGTYPQAFKVAGKELRPLARGGDRYRARAGRQPDAGSARAGGDRREARRAPGRSRPGRRRPGARRHPRRTAEPGAAGDASRARLAVVRSHAGGPSVVAARVSRPRSEKIHQLADTKHIISPTLESFPTNLPTWTDRRLWVNRRYGAAPRETVRRGTRRPGRSACASTPRLCAPEAQPSRPAPKPPCPEASGGRGRPPARDCGRGARAVRRRPAGQRQRGRGNRGCASRAARLSSVRRPPGAGERFTCAVRASSIVTAKHRGVGVRPVVVGVVGPVVEVAEGGRLTSAPGGA